VLRRFYLIYILLLFSACGSDHGNEVHGGNLTVYFTNTEDQEMAENIARFWKDNDLLTGEKQDLKLVKEGDWYELNIIAKNPKEVAQMSFTERKVLLDLQKSLHDYLKNDHVQIVLSDANFEPLYNINQ